MKRYTKLTLKIYWRHAMKYKPALTIKVACVVIATVAGLIVPLYYKKLIDGITAGASAEMLIGYILTALLIYLGSWIFWRIGGFVGSYAWSRIMRDLADSCFAYLQKHSTAFFNSNFVGSLVTRVNKFFYSAEAIADKIIFDLVPLIVSVVVIVLVFGQQNISLAIIMMLWTTVYCAASYLFSRWKLKYDIERSIWSSKNTGVLADTITNQQNVKLFVGYEREKKYFGFHTNKMAVLRQLTWNLNNTFEAVQTLLMIGLEIGIFYIAVIMWQRGLLTVGDFVLIQAYLFTLFGKIFNFGRIIRDTYERLADAEEMAQIFGMPHEIVDAKGAAPLTVSSGAIQFRNVSFAYHKTRTVVRKLTVAIAACEKIALVGPSGAGKSTIVKLLLRLHDVSSGKISIDGEDIARVTLESLWNNVSLVPQDPVLFHRTLMENIRYGKPEATDAEVVSASKLAHCDEFIREFPDGYGTFVGERGVKLSGGERQRVAIARAILRDAPILVFDEATSSLDSESEMLIQKALDVLMKGKTVIVIAHRLSTIMKMDRILVMDKGEIVEQGTHQELLAKSRGLYKKLWTLQSGGFIT